MKITTTQVSAEDALRAVADGKQVQMIWECDGKAHFSDFNESIQKQTLIGKAWLIVEIADSCEDVSENCENAAVEVHPEIPETIVTDPDTTPITAEIPNSKREERARWRKIDDELIVKLRKDGLSEYKIADELNSSQVTIHNHIQKLKKEGRL